VKKKPLHVSLHAREPSVVELTVGDRVQLDRLIPAPGPSARGVVAERHGRLLDPGMTRLALPAGHYFFKTLTAASLRVVTGGVAAGIARDVKNPWPPPASDGSTPPGAVARGDDAPGEPPSFTVEGPQHATGGVA